MVLQGIQLHVEVKDFDNETVNTYDSVDDDLIDSFSVDSGSRTTIGSSVTVTKVGTYRYGMLGLTATILCAQFFYGDQCQLTELCEPNGTCIEIKINDCEGQNCSGNGQCVNSYTCVCSPGYTGTYCETNINDCKDQNCSRNGICLDRVDSFLCECNSGFKVPTVRQISMIVWARTAVEMVCVWMVLTPTVVLVDLGSLVMTVEQTSMNVRARTAVEMADV